MAVAIIQTIFAVIIYAAISNINGAAARVNMPVLLGTIFGIAIIFWGLYFWARRNPFPAAVAGLVIYITLWLIDIVAWTSTASSAPRGGSPGAVNTGPFNGIIVKIIIIAVLVNAIKAGARYRQLQRQQAQGM